MLDIVVKEWLIYIDRLLQSSSLDADFKNVFLSIVALWILEAGLCF